MVLSFISHSSNPIGTTDFRIMFLTIAMTAAPAPASAHTNKWKVKSSCKKQTNKKVVILVQVKDCSRQVPPASFGFTSLDSHILKNFSDPIHIFFSSEMPTAPGKLQTQTFVMLTVFIYLMLEGE